MKYTSDYSIFKKKECNRELDSLNLRKVEESIRTRNLLALRPILVNEDMEVIDGQHRLEAAKRLNVPIYYTVTSECEDEDIILLNANQKKWDLNDYLNFHIYKGKEDYIKFAEFRKNNNLRVESSLMLLGYVHHLGKAYQTFKEGKFVYPSKEVEEEAISTFSIMKEVRGYLALKLLGNKKFIYNGSFGKALIYFFTMFSKEIDRVRFMEKLEARCQVLRPSSYENYIEMLKDIYNFRSRDKI